MTAICIGLYRYIVTKAMIGRVVKLRKKGRSSRPGDNWIGVPYHEAPGWYRVYGPYISTLVKDVKRIPDKTENVGVPQSKG
jgi:hypothetical protein